MISEIQNRRKIFRNKIRGREKIFGAWTSLFHPSITEMFCAMKPDFVGIDIEHSTMSLEDCQRIIETAQSSGSLCLPRIASHNPEMIKRLLDAGADGLIVPMVDSAAQARMLVECLKYPPHGKRNYGVARAQGFGFDFETYTRDWNESSTLIVQIESVEGVRNCSEILAEPGVDGVMIGPYDISGSLGIPGQIEHPSVQAACAEVVKAAEKAGKTCGTQLVEPTSEAIKLKHSIGFNFVVLGSDIFLIWKWTEKMAELVRCHR